jgi:hypothetical protein
MRIGILGGAVVAALLAGSQASVADVPVKMGHLECNVAAGLSLVVTSSKEMHCTFTSYLGGFVENYTGTIRKYGLDIGGTNQGVLIWDVFAPAGGPMPGALAGDYIGGAASATVGIGLGFNALVSITASSPGHTVTLQPLSTQAQTGLNFAAGVGSLTLQAFVEPPPRVLRHHRRWHG